VDRQVGDEGGFLHVNLAGGTEDALDTIAKALKNAGYKLGDDVMIVAWIVLLHDSM